MSETKTAFISIVGCPNVGKSTLLNQLLGHKIAIVSDKPQTTRTRIMGVLTEEDVQLVFTDTPGMHRPRTKLGEKMVKAVGDSIAGVDACLLVADAQGEVREIEKDLISRFKTQKCKAVLALNKIDLLTNKDALLQKILQFSQIFPFEAVVPISAMQGEGVPALLEELRKLSTPSPYYFDPDTLTDQPERVLAAEMIREKLLCALDKEIPHGIAVGIEKMREREDQPLLDVEAVIYCERESHKGIIIGKQGSMLKKVSTQARMDMEHFFDCRVNLQCWVKVKEGWRNREGLIRNFGLSQQE